MGRLNQGLYADLLGEHVVLEAQRAIERLCRSAGVATRLIVASMREWQTFVRVAECDACTAPAAVLARAPGAVRGGACGAHQWSRDVVRGRDARRRPRAPALGAARLARLWRVEPEFVDFLLDYRASTEYRDLEDGDALAQRFDTEGFGDFFYAPTTAEWSELRCSKLPDVHAPLTSRVALDTLYSLLADGDFAKEQKLLDAQIVAWRHDVAVWGLECGRCVPTGK